MDLAGHGAATPTLDLSGTLGAGGSGQTTADEPSARRTTGRPAYALAMTLKVVGCSVSHWYS